MAQIDVVIPMYNSEEYIDGLLRTLEKQTFRNFCAVFVDDGSKDNTYQVLCDNLNNVSFDYRIIRQENRGLPGARNAGIRGSESPWIVFVDSDDGLDAHYLEFLFRAVTESSCPVAVSGYQILKSEEEIKNLSREEYQCRVSSSSEAMREYYRNWFGAWALILNRQWLAGKELLFDEECTYLEDVPFITQVLAHSDSVARMDAPAYLYYQRVGSLMHTPKIEKYQVALDGFSRMEEKLRKMKGEGINEFFSVGRARYYLATLRKAAVLMEYKQFLQLCKRVPFEKEKEQFCNLQKKHRVAAYMYVISKRLFYHAMRVSTK